MQDNRNQVDLIMTTRNIQRSATRNLYAFQTCRLRRGAAPALTLACLCASTLSAAPVGAQTSASNSSTVSNSADWTSASSGWTFDKEEIAYAIPPTGTWKLQDQQWFTPGAAPAGWTTFATQTKPTAAAWANAPSYNNDTTSTSEDLAQSLLDISIGGDKTTVVANSALLDQDRLIILDSDGHPISIGEMISDIDAFRTSSGWSLSPDLDASSFRADNPSDLSKVLSFNMIVRLDDSDAFDSLYTSHGSSVTAFTPEPGAVALLAGVTVSFTGVIFKRRRRR